MFKMEQSSRSFNPADAPLVETDWLAAHLNDPNLRIIDARWREDGSSKELFKRGHIPGAVPLDWQSDFGYTDERGVRDLLLPPAGFAALMEASGIDDNTLVVAYAETDYSGAARLWWALRYYGHLQVVILNGGWSKWVAEGRTVSTTAVMPVPVRFTPHPAPAWLATVGELEIAVATISSHIKLVDTRPLEQYQGKAVWTPSGSRYLVPAEKTIEIGARAKMRAGHIPGAIHWHASTTFDATNWTLLFPAELQQQALVRGLIPEQRIITYCGVGISASQGLFALYVAGFRNLALYDASWEEWGTDSRLPVE